MVIHYVTIVSLSMSSGVVDAPVSVSAEHLFCSEMISFYHCDQHTSEPIHVTGCDRKWFISAELLITVLTSALHCLYVGETGRSFGVQMKERKKEVELQEGRKYTGSTKRQSQ